MIIVVFEVLLPKDKRDDYLKTAAEIRPVLEKSPGFISVERFQSLSDESKLLSLSTFADEAAVAAWRNELSHRVAQAKGRDGIFTSYRIRVAHVARDYSLEDRMQAPADSQELHKKPIDKW